MAAGVASCPGCTNLERTLVEFPEPIIDFGAGHAHLDAPEDVRCLRAALDPLPNVFFLMPGASIDEATATSIARDRERLGSQWDESRAALARDLVRSPTMRAVAKHVVLTAGRPVEAALAEILGQLR